MSQTCTQVETEVLVPGTGVYAPVAAENWDSWAYTALEPVNIYGSWRYAFDPVAGSVFMTGVFDNQQYTTPRPNRYVLAVEFRLNEYRIRFNSENTDWLVWSDGDRLAMQGEFGMFRVFRDGTEVWRSQ